MLSIHNLLLIEEMHALFLKDKTLLEPTWRAFFEGMACGETVASSLPSKEIRIYHLIEAYRSWGHLLAHVNPIETRNPILPHQLNLETLGFSENELSENFPTLGLLSESEAPLGEIINTLKSIYGGTISIEYMHSSLPEMQKWLQKEIEPARFRPTFSPEKKKSILMWLDKSTLFETFLHTKYTGQKRFSLEGGETLIPILHEIIETGSEDSMDEFVIGMAHRGRLNVLTNILNKSYASVFSEFEDYFDPKATTGTGDVKYHKGFSSDIMTSFGKHIHISLSANPSHLESVDPVVSGKVLAKQVQRKDEKKNKVIPIIIHGDASIAGQGVVYETMQFFNLAGYSTGGTIHLVINNQIGFTTLPKDGRSTPYCTSIASAFSAPVFHVNAEDPEGCVWAARLALLIRQKYGLDVFIDMNCYRKYGHNESDEPAFTQPLEYDIIRKKKTIREMYLNTLIDQKVLEKEEADKLEKEFHDSLHKQLDEIKEKKEPVHEEAFSGIWSDFHRGDRNEIFVGVKTGVEKKLLQEAAIAFSKVPKGFSLHPKVAKLFEERKEVVLSGSQVDFALAEHLAFATLLSEGTHVRLSGQDSRRGTFSQRHAVWIDQKNGHNYYPLSHLSEAQGRFDVIDSPLSEFASLGFEYGYSLAYPSALVLWEAQYGDFANGGQVIIDQYIAASEQKWRRSSGLVLLLPHGFEGQGPEHSSARLERFLQLAGGDNLQIVYPTTPANYFHLLRRQVLMRIRKPLVVMTPKALLRAPFFKSPFDEFVSGAFQTILEDPLPKDPVERLILCSGRVYYDLLEARKEKKEIALVRIEQLYPLDRNKLEGLLKEYKNLKEILWVQEEPENMGAFKALYPSLLKMIPQGVKFAHVARPATAAVAVGSHAIHVKEQKELMNKSIL